MGRPCTWNGISRILRDMAVYRHKATRAANREMGRLLPKHTCQNLKNKGIACRRYVGRREEMTANEGMKIVSPKRTQPYPENYSAFRNTHNNKQKLYE